MRDRTAHNPVHVWIELRVQDEPTVFPFQRGKILLGSAAAVEAGSVNFGVAVLLESVEDFTRGYEVS
jgi:hypothetical protein